MFPHTTTAASGFTIALFGAPFAGPLGRILVWTIHNRTKKKTSYWPRIPEEVDSLVAENRDTHEVYFALAMPPKDKDLRSDNRVESDEAAGIPGLWIEFDYDTPYRKKKGLPPAHELQAAIKTLPAPAPSLIVDSGGGYHCYWPFRDGQWVFQNDAERDEAQELVLGWQAELRRHVGFTVDSTHDLARVLRVPGTRNHKGDTPVDVRLLQDNGQGPTVEEWRALEKTWPPAKKTTQKGKKSRPGGPESQSGPSFTVRADAKPDAERLELLREASAGLRATLDHVDGKDFPSASECDMSIASYAVQAPSWTNQDVVDLMVFHRRLKHPDNPNPKHAGAYETTLRKARERQDDDNDAPTMDAGDMAIAEILRVCDGDGSSSRYRLKTPDEGVLLLRDGSFILDQRRFRLAVLDAFGVALRSMKNEQWEPFVQRKLTPMIRTVHPGDPDYPQGGDRAAMLEWIDDYLDLNMTEVEDGGDMTDAPFKKNGEEHILPAHFAEWLGNHRNESFTNKGLNLRLKDVGWETKKVRIGERSLNRWIKAPRTHAHACVHAREAPEQPEQPS